MQLAERWLGFGTIALAFALAPIALMQMQRGHHRHVRSHHHAIDLDALGCTDAPHHVVPPVERPNPVQTVDADTYASIFQHALPHLSRCMPRGGTVQLLISIGANGHVVDVSARPDAWTPESRCLAQGIRPLRFPPTEHSVVIRVPFSAP